MKIINFFLLLVVIYLSFMNYLTSSIVSAEIPLIRESVLQDGTLYLTKSPFGGGCLAAVYPDNMTCTMKRIDVKEDYIFVRLTFTRSSLLQLP